MHELSITESILEIALRHMREAGASRVTDLYLVIGELSTVVDESVQFYWDIITVDTPAAGSRLHFRRVAAEMTCLNCGRKFGPRDALACPACDGIDIRIDAGEEFFLESIEVASGEASPLVEAS